MKYPFFGNEIPLQRKPAAKSKLTTSVPSADTKRTRVVFFKYLFFFPLCSLILLVLFTLFISIHT